MTEHRLRIWPSGLVGRVILVLLAAVALEYVGSAVLLEWEVLGSARTGRAERMAWQVGHVAQLASKVPAREMAALVGTLSDSMLSLSWNVPTGLVDQAGPRTGVLAQCANLLTQEPGIEGHALYLRAGGVNAQDLQGAVTLPTGRLDFTAPGLLAGPPPGLEALISTAILAAGVSLAAIMVVRELAAPLRGLARIADLIGGPQTVLVAETGPREVRKVAHTLNIMQARIRRLIDDRTQALAAVSHDLRTPIARMRLQADFVVDPDAQRSMIESLDDMEHMVASVLTYLGGETDTEKPRAVDLALMLMTQADDATDAGGAVQYDGPENARAFIRPQMMKRAFANLIANGMAYAGGAIRVRLEDRPDALVVRIDDDGPGIAQADLALALQPFSRLEPSRGRNSGGVGLGLSIVAQAVEREGGTLTLSNRVEGGLRAEVTLPKWRKEGVLS